MRRIGPKHPIKVYLREWRESRSLTQKRLADLLDTDDMTISRWERGVVKMNIENMAAVAEVLGIDTADLLHDPDQPSPSELLRQQTAHLDAVIASLATARKARG